MAISRRRFLKLLAGVAVTFGFPSVASRFFQRTPLGKQAGSIPASVADATIPGHLVHLENVPSEPGKAAYASAPPPPPSVQGAAAERRWVMVIDLAKCNGCRECTVACDRFHFVPPGQEWIKVYANRDNETAGPYWFPRPCMQCDNPPCVKVCPVSATYKREDGIVIQDLERCIGCRFCIPACPYSARSFNWGEPPHTPEELAQPYSIEWNYPHRKGVVEKCIFCPVLVKEGRLPACVQACPMGALSFGDEYEDAVTNSQGKTVRFSELIRENGGYRFLEELGTQPRVYYLPPRNRLYPPPPQDVLYEERGKVSQEGGHPW